jgi:HSP20 family molecular chaperone IbpA
MVEKTNSPAWWPGFAEPFRHMGERIADWFAPRAEAKASDAHYEITMELPGVSESDIDITLHEGVLTVKGAKNTANARKRARAISSPSVSMAASSAPSGCPPTQRATRWWRTSRTAC